jgi:hypothetical protein
MDQGPPLIPLMLLFSMATVQSAIPTSQQPAKQPEQQCFNFAQAATFKTIDDNTIRVTAAGTDFDLDLAGEQCAALDTLKDIAIQSAPSVPMCIGAQNGRQRLSFGGPHESEPLRCSIMNVSLAATKTDAPKPPPHP